MNPLYPVLIKTWYEGNALSDLPSASKACKCDFRENFDVIADLRKESNTYGQWRGFYLSSENHKSLFVPKGFAHGFLSLCDGSTVMYQCDGVYDKETDTGILFCDADIDVKWSVEVSAMIVGQRDRALMSFREFDGKCGFDYKNNNIKI